MYASTNDSPISTYASCDCGPHTPRARRREADGEHLVAPAMAAANKGRMKAAPYLGAGF